MYRSTKMVGSLTALAALSFAGSAMAQAPTQVGMLQCAVAGGTGYVITSSKALDCQFTPDSGAPPEHYYGTVSRFGLDLGVTGPGELAWGVLAPTARFGPGSLAGTYGGVGGSATVGVGGGANLLVGGSSQTTSLQPLSVQGQTGLNIAAGIGEVTLEYAPAAPLPRLRHHYRRHRHH